MNPIILHPVIFYSFLSFSVILAAGCVFFMWKWLQKYFMDLIIFIDQSDRWKMVFDKIGSKSMYENEGKKYVLGDAILNRKGKALYIFSNNKPAPLSISYNKAKWLNSESLMAVINNKLVQQLVKTTDNFKDSLILFGAIGGMIAGLASVLILLKQFGVL